MSNLGAVPPKKTFRDSAVVVLIRGQGAGLEAYWVRRSDAVAVQPGFWAFVGGKVDAQDAALPLVGVTDDTERAARACAIREALEETGVLVAVDGPVHAAHLAVARRTLLEGEMPFAELAQTHGWRFDASRLTFAGRWQTPVFAAARFDTLFFLARVPPGQEPDVIPGELAHGEWVRPADAIARWKRGEVTFAAPILWTMQALAEGEAGLAERLAQGPARAGAPVRRVELQWGVVLHPMATQPLPPARHTNAYLVGERDVALIDPGSGSPDELLGLFAVADVLAAEGRRVTTILATHHHPDHTGGIAAARGRFGVPVAGHPALAAYLPLDRMLADGDVVPLRGETGDWSLRALHVPGHTRDSVAFHLPRSRALFTGDLIPGGAGTVVIDPPDGNMSDYLASLERVASLELETLFPAHGSPQGAAVPRTRALIGHRIGREARVIDALAVAPGSPKTLLEIAYAGTPRELWPYAERSLIAHLEKLEREGRAYRDPGGWHLAEPRS